MEAYQQLEIEWSRWNDLPPEGMVCVSSGTSALHLALEAMRLPQGSEVVVPDLTMIAVPRAVTMAGLTPVFVDCDDTLNMDFNLLSGSVKAPYPSALIAVHTYGKQCYMDWFWGLEEDEFTKYKTYVVEDLAEAHGVRPSKYADAAIWSHYRNKIVSGAEGGTVWFRDHEYAKLARQLRSLGFTDEHDFTHIPRGHNYRMSNVHASLILDSLKRIDLTLENRWLQWYTYNELCPKEWRMQRPDAPWVFPMRIKGMTTNIQNAVVRALHADGVAARHCFKPMHMQEEYQGCRLVPPDLGCYVKSWVAAQEVIYLPLSSYTTKCHLEAFDVIQRILDR